jgi:hypothetical protein
MKKKLEADLISIAHRILKLKNKSELIQLHQETQKLYEKLSVLLFVENHFQEAKPTIGLAKIEEDLAAACDALDTNDVTEPVTESIEDNSEITAPIEAEVTPIVEPIEALETQIEVEAATVADETFSLNHEDKNQEEPEFVAVAAAEITTLPHFELFKEEPVLATPDTKKELHQISLEDMLGTASEPIFERVSGKEKESEKTIQEPVENAFTAESKAVSNETTEILLARIEKELEMKSEKESEKESATVNTTKTSTNGKSITFGLNDRIAFEKQLFGGSSEDLNRVISQLSTYDTLQEAQDFIEEMVKPDYNNWEGKEEYINRFMGVVENKFS